MWPWTRWLLRRWDYREKYKTKDIQAQIFPFCLLCTTSYLIILSVRGRKDNKCVEERTDVQVPPWALMCGVHCWHPTAAHWEHLLASLGSWFSLEGFTHFVHQWDRQQFHILPILSWPFWEHFGTPAIVWGVAVSWGGWKSVLPGVLVDCKTFLAFLSVLQSLPKKARQCLVLCGWNRQNIKDYEWTGNMESLWKRQD